MANFKIAPVNPSEEDVDQTFSSEEYVNQITDSQIEMIKNKGYFSPNMCFCNNCYHMGVFIEEIDPLIINGNMVVICKNCGKYIPIKPYDYSIRTALSLSDQDFPKHVDISNDTSKQLIKTHIKNFVEQCNDGAIITPGYKTLLGLGGLFGVTVDILDPRIEYDAFGQRKLGVYIPTYEEYFNLEKEKEDVIYFIATSGQGLNDMRIIISKYKNYKNLGVLITFEDGLQIGSVQQQGGGELPQIIQSQIKQLLLSLPKCLQDFHSNKLSKNYLYTLDELLNYENHSQEEEEESGEGGYK